MRAPGVLVLVDGYNISHAQWHGLPPAEQREPAARRAAPSCTPGCGTDVEVVFDGDGERDGARRRRAAAVRHRFTPAGVEADDVILARVDEEPPPARSSWSRATAGCATAPAGRGANVLGAKQFLHVLRR